MKKIISLLLIIFLTSCETVSDFSMPNLGMPDLNQYKINPFNKTVSDEKKCPSPMILADAISINEFFNFDSTDEDNIIYRARIDRVDFECNVEEGYAQGDLYITGTISLGPKAEKKLYSLPAFVAAVNNKKDITSRKFINIDVQIPDGATLARFEYINENYKVNFEDSRASKDYQILAGFNLTADQITYNNKRE